MAVKPISQIYNLKVGMALIASATTAIIEQLTAKMQAAGVVKIDLKAPVPYHDPAAEHPEYTSVALGEDLVAEDWDHSDERPLSELPVDEFLAILEALPKKFRFK
jgi:hypothetical protein